MKIRIMIADLLVMAKGCICGLEFSLKESSSAPVYRFYSSSSIKGDTPLIFYASKVIGKCGGFRIGLLSSDYIFYTISSSEGDGSNI
jgi:hypothetical protein